LLDISVNGRDVLKEAKISVHALRAYGWSRGISPIIRSLGVRCR